MELLVATLAHTTKGNHEDALTRVRLVVDTVKKAPGIIHTSGATVVPPRSQPSRQRILPPCARIKRSAFNGSGLRLCSDRRSNQRWPSRF